MSPADRRRSGRRPGSPSPSGKASRRSSPAGTSAGGSPTAGTPNGAAGGVAVLDRPPAAGTSAAAASDGTSPSPSAMLGRWRTWRTWGPWAAVLVVLLGAAAVLRLWDLPLSPFHNDEGVNGWFTTQLLRTGTWHYDPSNYHGPSLFYADALAALLVGLSDVSMRLVPAVFGLATLGLALLTWRWIGRGGALVSAALLAVSPGMVYFSRYAIHEMLLVCFTLALVIAAARWWETGRTRYALGASASLALMFATKETAIISVVVLLLATGCLAVYERYAPAVLGRRLRFGPRPGAAAAASSGGRSRADGRARAGMQRSAATARWERFGGEEGRLRTLIAAALIFVAIWVTLFSSLFTNPAGIGDSLRSLFIWTQTSGATQVSPPGTYVSWMAQEELPILLLGLAASAWVAWEGRSRFAIFAAAWATGLLLAYSLIGYKTPWLILNWLVPYALVAAYALGRAWQARRQASRVGVGIVVAAALAMSAVQAVQLSFVDYDRDGNPYVYLHTQRDTLDLVSWLRADDARLGTGGQLGVVVMSPDYWPLPWYLRDDPKAGFYGQVVDVAAPVQIVREDQLKSLPAGFSMRYREQARYSLRPGVRLIVFTSIGS